MRGVGPIPFPHTNSIRNRYLRLPFRMVSRVQCPFVRFGAHGASWGETLTVIRSAECVAALKMTTRPAVVLPVLVILFIVSYGIFTLLVFEQGQTIESQRSLIREMLKDSTQLAALKGKLARDDSKRAQDKAPAEQQTDNQADHKDSDSGNPAAGTKGPDKEAKRPGKSAHTTKEAPGRPAADMQDVRRCTRTI